MPLADLHRVAVHLRFNPENLLVPNKNTSVRRLFSKVESTPLKLIGLEGAFSLEMGRNIEKINDDEIEGHHHFSQTANGRYMAPEYLDKKISTKLDIWSAGIVIYELLLVNYFYQNSIFEKITNPQKKKKTTKEQIDKIAEFYRGFLITDQPGTSSECNGAQIGLMKNNTAELPNVGSAQWWNRYREVVQIILELWCQQNMPEIVFLLTNILGADPTKRMSATEILDFLEGKCAPKIENVDKMSFFGTADADFLSRSIEMEIQRTSFFDEKRREILKSMRSMLEKVKKHQKELLSTLAKRKHCNGQ
ncbi:hypothetical protein niasHT_031880 [Heterodera trifolii]|uniref:Protein kinase domain-containing protein n=1 Tax=Heterodera trifolii TaxID=157864 RepID=A0ABD2I2A2_9BILA